MAHERSSLYSENEFWLSISSEARLDGVQTLREIFQLRVDFFENFENKCTVVNKLAMIVRHSARLKGSRSETAIVLTTHNKHGARFSLRPYFGVVNPAI